MTARRAHGRAWATTTSRSLSGGDAASWMLRSPRRWRWVKRTPGLVLIGLIAFGCAVQGDDPKGPGTPVAAPTTAPPNVLLPTAPPTSAAPLTPSAAPLVAGVDLHDPAAVAAAFVAAWAHPERTSTAWQTGIAPFTTADYAGVLATVDPARTPAATVVGPAVPEPTLSDDVVSVYRVNLTGASSVLVHVRQTLGTWGVALIEPGDVPTAER